MAMAEDPLYQLALEASSRSLDPDLLAHDLFLLPLRIFMEIQAIGEELFNDPMLEEFIELKDRFIRWGANFFVKNGGLDKLPLEEELRRDLLEFLCHAAKLVANLAGQTRLKETLVDVFQQIDRLDSHIRLSQSNNVSPASTVDDLSSTESEASISSTESEASIQEEGPDRKQASEDAQKKALKKALKDIKDSQSTLYRWGALIDRIAEEAQSAAPIGDSSNPTVGPTTP